MFGVGLGRSRCACVVLCGFLLVCAGLAAFVSGSVWFCVLPCLLHAIHPGHPGVIPYFRMSSDLMCTLLTCLSSRVGCCIIGSVLSGNMVILDLISIPALPGTGSQGVPFISATELASNLDYYLAGLLMLLALSTPLDVPMITSVVSGMIPSHITYSHLSSYCP